MPQPDNCGEGTSASWPIVVSEVLTGQELLTSFSRQVVNDSADYVLSVDRSNQESLWMAVISFYKNAKSRPQKLQKQVVHFKGEAGADSGSLQWEFFEDGLKEANARLFDGEDDRRIPKKDWSL